MFHTKLVRSFSAINKVIPVSSPMTSVSYHFFKGLNALTGLYRLQASEPYRLLMFFRPRNAGPGRKANEPPAALGTMVPSTRASRARPSP